MAARMQPGVALDAPLHSATLSVNNDQKTILRVTNAILGYYDTRMIPFSFKLQLHFLCASMARTDASIVNWVIRD